MAKSLRSKWRRKMRAVKRERYGEKEMKRLNEMLINAGDIQFIPEIKEEKEEENMVVEAEAKEIEVEKSTTERRSRRDRVDTRNRAHRAEQVDLTAAEDADESIEKMTVDGERIFRRKTMRDQYGNYPDWMNKRKMRTQQKKNKRLKKRAKSLKRK